MKSTTKSSYFRLREQSHSWCNRHSGRTLPKDKTDPEQRGDHCADTDGEGASLETGETVPGLHQAMVEGVPEFTRNPQR